MTKKYMNEEIITFKTSKKNYKGILHHPEKNNLNSIILFLGNPDWYNWGPRRILLEASRFFSTKGFKCFRFDGICINENDRENKFEIDFNEILEAVSMSYKFLINNCIINEDTLIYYIGYCLGTYINIHVNNIIPIDAIILWSIYLKDYNKPNSSEIHNSDLLHKSVKNKKKPLLVINGSFNNLNQDEYNLLKEIFNQEYYNFHYKCFKNCDQYFSNTILKLNLFKETFKWIKTLRNEDR
ncbi:MAG: hypothetical protein ACFFG0_10625 [Candidatus Thorarchaeota archaeon]